MGNTDGPPETDYPQLHSKAAVAGERVTGMKGDSDKKHRDVPSRDTIFETKIDATRNELRGTVNDLSLDLKDLREGRRARGVAPAVSPPSPQSTLKGRNHGCLEALLAGYHRHQSPVQLDTRNLLDGRLGSYTRTRNVPWTGNVPPRS